MSVSFATQELKELLVYTTMGVSIPLSKWLESLDPTYFQLATLTLGFLQKNVTGARVIQILAGSSLTEAGISTGALHEENFEKDTTAIAIRMAPSMQVEYPVVPKFNPTLYKEDFEEPLQRSLSDLS